MKSKKMKKILISILAVSAVLAGCNNVLIEDTDTGMGQLALDLSASDEFAIVSKASGLRNEDVNEFTIKMVRQSDGLVKEFDRFGDMPAVFSLPSGNWTLTASSPETYPAAFDQPIYGTTHNFDIKVGEVSTEKLTCTLQNIKVSFDLDEAFKSELKDYTITVSNGDAVANKLFWTNVVSEVEDQYTTKDMTASGYFTVAPLIIRVDATRKVDNSDAYHEIVLNDLKAKDHVIVKLGAKVTGQAQFDIEIDPSVNGKDVETSVPGFNEDAVDGPWDGPVGGGDTGSGDNGSGDNGSGDNGSGDNGSGEGGSDDDGSGEDTENPIKLKWDGYDTLPSVTEIADEMSVDLKLTCPAGIKDFKIKIESETPAFLTLVTLMTSTPRTTDSSEPVVVDLINDETAVGTFSGVGLATGDDLKNATEVGFALSGLVPMIPSAGQADPDTYHTFTLIVKDNNDVQNQWSLTFHVSEDYDPEA